MSERLRRTGAVIGGNRVRISQQTYPLYGPTNAIFTHGQIVTVENVGSETDAVWTPVEHYGTLSAGAKRVQTGQGRMARQGMTLRAAATRTGNFGTNRAQLAHPLNLDAARTMTVALGVVQVESDYHFLAAESGTADSVDTINPADLWTRDPDGTFVRSAHIPFLQLLVLQAEPGHTITLVHGTGNLAFNGEADIELSGDKTILLFFDGVNWTDLGTAPPATVAARADVSISYNINNSAWYIAREDMTLASAIEAGDGTLAYAKALAADQTTFSPVSFPITLAPGDVLRVTLTGMTTYHTVTMHRTA